MEYKSVDLAHLHNDNILFLNSVHLSSRDNPRHELRNMKLEGIEYAKILKQGKFKDKVLNINSIRGLKNDIIRLKHCISVREKTYVDDCRRWDELKKQIEWDSCHVIEFIDKKCKIKGCDSNNICAIKMQDNYYHYGKELCPKCYGFQKWIPYPNEEDD